MRPMHVAFVCMYVVLLDLKPSDIYDVETKKFNEFNFRVPLKDRLASVSRILL